MRKQKYQRWVSADNAEECRTLTCYSVCAFSSSEDLNTSSTTGGSHYLTHKSIEEENSLGVSDHSILNVSPLGPNTAHTPSCCTGLGTCVRKLWAHLVPAVFHTIRLWEFGGGRCWSRPNYWKPQSVSCAILTQVLLLGSVLLCEATQVGLPAGNSCNTRTRSEVESVGHLLHNLSLNFKTPVVWAHP